MRPEWNADRDGSAKLADDQNPRGDVQRLRRRMQRRSAATLDAPIQRACPRCGVRTTEDYCCKTCEFDLSVHAERLRNLARPYCGECGDTGREPREVMLGYVQLPPHAWEEQPCAVCPRCEECGATLRLHPRDTMGCP
jgi:hypothetical protein